MDNETNILLLISNSEYSSTKKYKNIDQCIIDVDLVKEFFVQSRIKFDKVYVFKNSPMLKYKTL